MVVDPIESQIPLRTVKVGLETVPSLYPAPDVSGPRSNKSSGTGSKTEGSSGIRMETVKRIIYDLRGSFGLNKPYSLNELDCDTLTPCHSVLSSYWLDYRFV